MRFGLAATLGMLIAAQASAQIAGAVTDPSGSVVEGALITLINGASLQKHTTVTGPAGAFQFPSVEPGSYLLTIAADGFATWTGDVVVRLHERQPLLSVMLRVAPASTKVDVTLPPRELAVEQLKAEEKQRLLGVFPHYFVNYDANAAPLKAAQKLQLGWKTIFDPVPILFSAIGAGIEQARNSYHEFGQGTEGYAKRFGAQYADDVNGTIIGHVLMHSVFRQDPRYFYKGTGSFRSRVLYAVATAFVCKGDNGHWQPDYSSVLGGLASGEISTLYYPHSSRTGLRLFHNVLLGFGGRASGNLSEEFLMKYITTHVPKAAMRLNHPVLREGTPMSLISVEDLTSKTAKDAGPVTFVLANDIEAGGAVLAKAGAKAYGEIKYSSDPAVDAEATHIGLQNVHIKVSGADVTLRATKTRNGAGPLEYRRLEDSGRIAITLYVAESVKLAPPQ